MLGAVSWKEIRGEASFTVTSVKGRRGVHIVERAHIVYSSGWEIGAASAGKAWDIPSDDDVRRASWALGLVPMLG